MESPPVPSGGLSLAKVVALDLGTVSAEPFPVDLVKVIRLQDRTADHTDTWSRFDFELDTSEHDVPFRGQLRGVPGLGDCERSTVGVKGRIALRGEGVGRALGEVYGN